MGKKILFDNNKQMTVFDASLKLYEWFSGNDAFTEKDLIKVMPITETPEKDRAAFFLALKNFEQNEMISLHQSGEDKTWVLKRCFAASDQSIVISYITAIQVSHVINSFCDMSKNETDRCDPTKITEDDVRNLVAIIHLNKES